MKPILSVISSRVYINQPNSPVGWVVLLLLIAAVVIALYAWKKFNHNQGGPWKRNHWLLFFVLLCLTLLTSLFLGIYFQQPSSPPPGVPVDQAGQTTLIFSALPWMLAGGLLGPLPAAILGLFSGVLRALWGSHSAFTPFVIMFMAVLFSVAVNQRYRTLTYRLLRQPVLAALLLALIYPALYLLTVPFTVTPANIGLAVHLDYALYSLASNWLSASVELIIAGLIAQLVMLLLPEMWGGKGPLQPSPAEHSLQARFFYSMAPIGILLVVSLMVGSWIVADSIARQSLQSQMEITARTVGYQLPYVINTGQTLITQIAEDPGLGNATAEQLPELLQKLIRKIPYFHQLIILDSQGKLIGAYPDDKLTGGSTPYAELTAIQFTLQGMPFETVSLPPDDNGSTAQISFIKGILGSNGTTKNILIGRTALETNPFSEPLIITLRSMNNMKAEGIILDQDHRILVHPDPSLLMTNYTGKTDSPENFYDETSSDGTRYLVEYQNVMGVPWSVVIAVPLVVAHQLALRIAAPLLGLILILTALAILVLSLGLRMITNSLKSLAVEAEDISRGKLDQPLQVSGEDEVAQLRSAFEKMRISLKTRIEELNSLLKVSQGVSANLEIGDAVKPVLNSALSMGGSMSRAILVPSVIPELDGNQSEPIRYSAGPAQDLYSDLDEQLLDLTRQKDRIILSSLTRPRLLTITPGLPQPSSLIAFALRHENQYYGSFWVAYDQPHTFLEEEVRYLATLANQAAVAAANSRIFLNAEIGRQRLDAILASSPDAVLVIDQVGRLILANPAAWQLFGIGIETEKGKPVEQVIHQKEMLALLQNSISEKQSAEITLTNGQVYLAAVSSVEAEGRKVGRVCVLRDVTQFKELDALKSEFVSTVSHDLRTPLALMRGYATMLEMVGQLNEQQTNYTRKIIASVESMSRLVNNLLDLGRIEAGVGLQPETVSASEIVERVVNSLQIQATQKKIQLKTEYVGNGKSVLLEADPAMLQQGIQNLVENAIKYTRNGGKVIVRVQPQAERVVFEVSDTGIGISPMDQPRLFEKFYRGPQPSTPENQGSGLGLAIVRSIAERHCGTVWVESKLGTGSTFYLAIPSNRDKT